MWTYSQTTGHLGNDTLHAGETAYSGSCTGGGKNNPLKQDVHDIGPLPRGIYAIQAPYNSLILGPYALFLLPDLTNEMFGRSGFYMHSDSIHHPGCASEGCIVCSITIRKQLWTSGDHVLEVTL